MCPHEVPLVNHTHCHCFFLISVQKFGVSFLLSWMKKSINIHPDVVGYVNIVTLI